MTEALARPGVLPAFPVAKLANPPQNRAGRFHIAAEACPEHESRSRPTRQTRLRTRAPVGRRFQRSVSRCVNARRTQPIWPASCPGASISCPGASISCPGASIARPCNVGERRHELCPVGLPGQPVLGVDVCRMCHFTVVRLGPVRVATASILLPWREQNRDLAFRRRVLVFSARRCASASKRAPPVMTPDPSGGGMKIGARSSRRVRTPRSPRP